MTQYIAEPLPEGTEHAPPRDPDSDTSDASTLASSSAGSSSSIDASPPAVAPFDLQSASLSMERDEALQRSSARYPDLYRAATSGSVSFHHLLQARQVRRGQSQVDQEIGRTLELVIRERFEGLNGPVLNEFWANDIVAGCLLTDNDVVHLGMNVDRADVVVLQTRVEQVCRDAQGVFQPARRWLRRNRAIEEPRGDRMCAQRREAGQGLFSIGSRLVAIAETLTKAPPQDSHAAATLRSQQREAVKALNAQWALTHRRIEVLIQRQARFDYFLGMLLGAPFALVMFGIIGKLATDHWEDQIAAPAFLAATISGTVGGVISVIQRMSSGQLVLDYTASVAQKRLLGAIRPLVAGTLAAIVQFGLLGGLLTMQGSAPTESSPATFAFFALAGFAAGFSERLATDMIERAGQVMNTPSPGGPAAGPPTESAQPLSAPPALPLA